MIQEDNFREMFRDILLLNPNFGLEGEEAAEERRQRLLLDVPLIRRTVHSWTVVIGQETYTI